MQFGGLKKHGAGVKYLASAKVLKWHCENEEPRNGERACGRILNVVH